MKEKILYLILGILIGAVITAGCFLVFQKTSNQGMRGEKPNFEDMEMSEDGEGFERGNRMKEGRGESEDSGTPADQTNDSQTNTEV